jgi:acylaminoacyl-peptidase
MHKISPVTYINNVTAPVLLCLGAKDRRVPYTQGLEYAQLLKAKGVKVSMLVFPEDCHALDKPTSEADQWVAIALHLTNYI